jgi:putative Mg2+ transporter-C (MgtC) family protein
MPTHVTWYAITLRLALTALAAAVIGSDRLERGRSAGLRTNLLVALAACISMIQANLLINSNGKPADSYVVADIMRLPLGILSGIGFIGAGAIIKRGELIVGLTTAATIWFLTVLGLCFGGGQIGLGIASFALGYAVLHLLRGWEAHMQSDQSATLRVSVSTDGPSRDEIESLLKRGGIQLAYPSVIYESSPGENHIFGWKLRWRAGPHELGAPPPAVQDLASRPDIRRLEFTR